MILIEVLVLKLLVYATFASVFVFWMLGFIESLFSMDAIFFVFLSLSIYRIEFISLYIIRCNSKNAKIIKNKIQ